MLELILRIDQHDDSGTIRTLGQVGGITFVEDKINSPGIAKRCQMALHNLMRSVAGQPELDDNMLVDNLTPTVATHMLQLVNAEVATIDSASIRDQTLVVRFNISQSLVNKATELSDKEKSEQ
jgi:hypothetical protein